MKLMICFIFLTSFQLIANEVAEKVTLKEHKSSLQKILKNIETQTGYTFLYNNAILEKASPVTVHVIQASVEQALELCFKGQPLTYKIFDRTVVIKEKVAEVPSKVDETFINARIANIVTGTVTNTKKEPVTGVSVTVKGTNVGTSTNANGIYSIDAPANGILSFSYVGFTSKEVPVNGKTVIDVALEENNSALDQVVVIGYGTEKKLNITGAVSVVDMDVVRSIPTGSVDKVLQGQAAGVTVINDGAPGVDSKILIRGISSFGDNAPLVLVDGVQSSLQNVNVNDIQSMQVLKDAGAAAIYGVRGSNGVIVITTKKGKTGTPVVSYDAFYNYEVPPTGNVYDMANAKDYAAFVYKMVPTTPLFPGGVLPDYLWHGPNGSGIGNEGDAAVDPSKYVFDPINRNDYLIQKVNKEGTDWFNEVFKPASTHSHTLTVSGGTDKSKYLMALGYLDQEGTMAGTYLKRYSARVNTEFKVHDNIRIGENIFVFNRSNPPIIRNTIHGNPLYSIHYMPTYIPVYDIMGNYGGNWIGPIQNGTKINPVALAKDNNWRNTQWNIIGNVYAEVDFLKHFSVRSSFGGTVDNNYYRYFQPSQYYAQEQHYLNNSYQEGASYNLNWIWTNTANYTQSFGSHNIKVLGGVEAIKNNGRNVRGTSERYSLTNMDYLILGNGQTNITNFSGAYNNSLFSIFSRVDYNFDEKYLIGVTVRRDGSSKFGVNNRYGVFPSFSAGWRVSSEPFMEKIGWLNDLKLRGSWGKLGSQNNLTDNNSVSLYNSGYGTSYYGLAGTGVSTSQGFYQSTIGNSYTGWEEDIITNIGFDASILNNKLSFSLEWFKKGINGLLFAEPLPATVGDASRPVINIGDIENKGFDASVIYRNTITKDFNYEIGLTFTRYRNIITNIPDPGYFDVGRSRNQTGHPVSAFFGYDVIGFFRDAADVSSSPTQTAAAPGRFKYRDVNGDKKITPDDRTFYGDPNPDFTYGINLGANYKNFDFTMTLYGSQGNDVYQPKNITWNNYPQSLHNDLVLRSWTPATHETAKAPIAENSSNFSQEPGSFLVEDGSFLKCRSLMLGYSIKPGLLKRAGISKLRLSLQASNLFMITNYTGLDPEVGGGTTNFGIDGLIYPNNMRGYSLGLSVSF